MFRRATSLLLTVILCLSTIPVSGAELPKRNSSLGAITGVGTVLVRGIVVNREGTLFNGDGVSTGANSHANVVFADGNRLELSTKTELVVDNSKQNLRVELTSGEIAFRASATPVTIVAGNYRITPAAGSSGGVQFVTADFAAVRVVKGSVTLRNDTDKSISTLIAGSERTFNPTTAEPQDRPFAKIASTMPAAVPAARRQGSGGTDWALWGPVIAGVGVGVAIMTYVAIREGCDDVASPSEPCDD